MIIKSKPISMPEATKYLEKENLKGFIKKFNKLKSQEAEDFRAKLEELNLMKINEKNITKIIDLLPTNQEEINKIFNNLSLDENETTKIIDVVKQFK
jgi:DNA-directed RNA polymerase subunit F